MGSQVISSFAVAYFTLRTSLTLPLKLSESSSELETRNERIDSGPTITDLLDGYHVGKDSLKSCQPNHPHQSPHRVYRLIFIDPSMPGQLLTIIIFFIGPIQLPLQKQEISPGNVLTAGVESQWHSFRSPSRFIDMRHNYCIRTPR